MPVQHQSPRGCEQGEQRPGSVEVKNHHMSKGIGFAGLGKHLADRTLGLLKGRKNREAAEKREDLRMNAGNNTDYDQLMKWQTEKRNRTEKIRRIIFLSVLFLVLFALLIFWTI